MQTHACLKTSSDEELNPIFEYAARGQHYENRSEWRDSIHWYQRALACLPNLFGADRKIRPLDILDRKTVSFNPQHASRIYASLGRVLKASDLHQDAFLAFQAADALNPDYPTDNSASHRNRIRAMAIETIPMEDGAETRLEKTGERNDLKEHITLIMASHCSQRLKKYEALSPPSCKLVTATYGSLLSVFGEDIDACTKILCYDQNPKGSNIDRTYTQNLESFARENGFIFHKFNGVGLFHVLHQTILSIDTPYIFFVEHDWMFRGKRILLPAIIEMMNSNPKINVIRLNKRENYLNGQDFLMNVESTEKIYPLLRTSSYSNNPSIIRTNKLKHDWLPQCKRSLHRVADDLGGSAFGIEEILFRLYAHDIRQHGFEEAHERWGLHVLGRVGDKPRITHLGE